MVLYCQWMILWLVTGWLIRQSTAQFRSDDSWSDSLVFELAGGRTLQFDDGGEGVSGELWVSVFSEQLTPVCGTQFSEGTSLAVCLRLGYEMVWGIESKRTEYLSLYELSCSVSARWCTVVMGCYYSARTSLILTCKRRSGATDVPLTEGTDFLTYIYNVVVTSSVAACVLLVAIVAAIIALICCCVCGCCTCCIAGCTRRRTRDTTEVNVAGGGGQTTVVNSNNNMAAGQFVPMATTGPAGYYYHPHPHISSPYIGPPPTGLPPTGPHTAPAHSYPPPQYGVQDQAHTSTKETVFSNQQPPSALGPDVTAMAPVSMDTMAEDQDSSIPAQLTNTYTLQLKNPAPECTSPAHQSLCPQTVQPINLVIDALSSVDVDNDSV